MFGSNREYLKLMEKAQKAKQESINERKNLLENVIRIMNELQDIQSLGISEKEKDIMRNNIINCKRSEFVDKIIELDRLSKQF